MNKKVIFLRKKIEGENSIEEVTNRISLETGASIIELPFESTKLVNMIKNIRFARKNQGLVNHIITGTEGYLLPFLMGKKIITYHDFGTLEASRNKIYKVLKQFFYIKPSIRYADCITFISEQTKSEYIRKMGNKDIKNLYVIHNSYDERLVFKEREKNEIPIILHIGTGPRKNLEGLLIAAKELNVRIFIVGKLSNSQKDLLIENKIKYKNFYDIPFKKIVDLYNICDIVSFPSFYEGFGLPIIEANIMQKPVISSDIPIIHEVGHNAVFYINPNNPTDIRSAIVDLIENQTLYNSYVTAGIENARLYSPNNTITKYKELYGEMI